MGRKASLKVRIVLDVPAFSHQVLSVLALAEECSVADLVGQLVQRKVTEWTFANPPKIVPNLPGVVEAPK